MFIDPQGPTYVACAGCGKPMESGQAVWIEPSGRASTSDESEPFHVGCAPEQYDDEGNEYADES